MTKIFDSRVFEKPDNNIVAISNKMKHRRSLFLSKRALLVQRLILLFLLLGLWQYASIHWIDPFYISSPVRIFKDLKAGFGAHGTLWRDTGVTLLEAGLGLVLGMISGLVVAVMFLESTWLDRLFEPVFAVLNAIPRPALAPLAVLWLGLSIWSKVFVAWSLVFFVAFYNAYEGGRAINRNIVNALRVMKASKWQILEYCTLPAVASWVFAAFKLSVAYSLIGAIVGEFVGAIGGLGYQLVQAQGLLRTDRVFSVLIVTGVLAWVALFASGKIEQVVLRWKK